MLQALTALLQNALSYIYGDIGVVEVVKKIKYQHRVTFWPDVGKEIEQLIAGKRPGDADSVKHTIDGGRLAAQGVDKRVSGQPFTTRDRVKRAAKSHGSEKLGDTFACPALCLDEQQAGQALVDDLGTGEKGRQCIHMHKIR